jgi:hypothetical protein
MTLAYNPQLTTQITQELLSELSGLGDVSTMGAPEMAGHHVHTGFSLRCSEIFEAHNCDPIGYIEDLARRGIRYKWVHFTGLLEALDFMDVPYYGVPTEMDEAINKLDS